MISPPLPPMPHPWLPFYYSVELRPLAQRGRDLFSHVFYQGSTSYEVGQSHRHLFLGNTKLTILADDVSADGASSSTINNFFEELRARFNPVGCGRGRADAFSIRKREAGRSGRGHERFIIPYGKFSRAIHCSAESCDDANTAKHMCTNLSRVRDLVNTSTVHSLPCKF